MKLTMWPMKMTMWPLSAKCIKCPIPDLTHFLQCYIQGNNCTKQASSEAHFTQIKPFLKKKVTLLLKNKASLGLGRSFCLSRL